MNSGQSKMRRGYTTGTCAAAAAKAAAYMLLTGQLIDKIDLQWQPEKERSIEAEFVVEDPTIGQDEVRCAVRKDGGDDIDVTDGLLIYAKVGYPSDLPEDASKNDESSGDGEILQMETNLDDAGYPESSEVTAEPFGNTPQVNIDFPLKKARKDSGNEMNQEQPELDSPESGLSVFNGEQWDLQEDIITHHPVTLSDLEDENGIIPMRWDKVADYFKSGAQSATVPDMAEPGFESEQRREGRFISLADDGTFSASEWSLIQELFHAAEETQVQEQPDPLRCVVLSDRERFSIRGGEGIGIVTKQGLDQPLGEAAINSGPRRMIREAVASICDICEFEGQLQIEISVPEGKKIALRTFNPRLGIEGGISILGTTGIVEPMSGRAVAETVKAEVRVKAASSKFLVFVPGNTGAAFVHQELLIPEEKIVIMSNYPGDALDEARDMGVRNILLTGSLGKMIKFAGGIFYTHSRDADARMDILMRCAVQAGASIRVLRELDSCVTTEAGLRLLEQAGLLDRTAEVILNRAIAYARQRADGMRIEMIILRNSGEVLTFSDEVFSVVPEEEDE